MQILNIAGYKFIELNNLESLRTSLLEHCCALKGTILLSHEGINISLAGSADAVCAFQARLKSDARFKDIRFHQSVSSAIPFKHLKVKIKKEIITLRQPEADPRALRAPVITPAEFRQWMDENRDFTLLDTRNDYEIRFGTFTGAVDLGIADFSEFPSAAASIGRNKPVVMFCTGGIRCEKAALHLLSQGYQEVYQLEGGILGYFKQIGGAHYEGECFVFDERISVNSCLQHTGTLQCQVCQGPVTREQQILPGYIPDISCPSCTRASQRT
ncbi:putative adenylyltransferase/sulfurtransferase MoeZ [Aquicella siphonis]|uniref:tRNA uridine(34) hydroxylase n=2 Tax=Aquicella siphonis TaxID=254247 RepID=A0A5E4PDE4_9COXI|nr:putative adenylyltransferase/sulfurtransferase MoeZ [Aquicella siphonis]